MNPAEEYIVNQEEPYRGILIFLRQFIEQQIPSIQLKYKYNIPFFDYKDRPFCYMSVPRGKRYVDLAFWHSAHLTLHQDQLHSKGRKVMKSLRYSSLEAIDPVVLSELLKEAESKSHLGFYKK